MRILSIRFMNLNSLIGKFCIDFTHPDYVSNGIFAITGPTGSGKTTILDAVCLGLYGRTPRLDRVTKSTNEIMSRQSGECYAEVTFETQKGRYRSHWSQRRARKKPDGELQPARHEISDASSGRVLESKINQVDTFVEKVTGMDFERFTRSMLLAQGGFAAFLQASSDKRAPILEQITGTEIYSRISVKVHERSREEMEKLDLLQSALKGIKILTEDEETALETSLKEKHVLEKEVAQKLNIMRRDLSWVEGIGTLTHELEELDKKIVEFEKLRLEFEPEAKKLEKSLRALTIEGDYQRTIFLRRQQDTDNKELRKVAELIPEKEKSRTQAESARQTAEKSFQEAQKRQSSEAEIIKIVRDIDARLTEKKKQIDEVDKALVNIRKQSKTYEDSIKETNKILNQSHIDLAVVDDFLNTHAVDAMLTTHLSAISKSFEALGDIEAKHLKACENLSHVAREKESAAGTYKKMEVDNEKLQREFAQKQGDIQILEGEIIAILQGHKISEWHKELDALKEKKRLLIQTLEVIKRIDPAIKALNELIVKQKTSVADLDKLMADIKLVAQQKTGLEKNVEIMEAQVSLLNRIHDLEEDRKRLEDGKPCPLCGSADHPFATGNVPKLSKAEKALKQLKTDFKKESVKLSEMEADQVKKITNIQHLEKDIADRKVMIAADEQKCADALHLLNITAAVEERTIKVESELSKVERFIIEKSGIVATAEEKSQKEKLGRTDLEKMRVKVEQSGKALQELKFKRETANSDHQRLIKESAALAQEAEQKRAEVLEDINPFGIRQISAAMLNDILKELTGRKNNWEAKQNEKTAREKKISDLKIQIDKDNALLINLDNDLVIRNKARGELESLYESLLTLRQKHFGDKNTDREERLLAEAVSYAQQGFEKKREVCGQIEKEISAINEKSKMLKENIDSRASELAQSEKLLKDRINKSGFENEADFLSACLPESDREALIKKDKELIEEKTQLFARKKDKSEKLAAEGDKKLTDQPREVIQEKIITLESDLRQLGQEIGAINKNLDNNLQQKKIQKDRIKYIEIQKREVMRWDALHQLIGSADGKKFRNFAQGLTFEMMIAHANQQLQKMTDRYILVRDASEPLELNVIDNYQAGEVRSTKNLSGGESFIVSLALALGLSRMASQNVRVDSLFLDEGFGTLDDDALETALDTLAELQQDGKLIGVISHVPALKERIGTQIQVIPETGGHSSLSGPGCQMI